jgi:hypothetical protein
MYKDLNSRDLYLKRNTDEYGNTFWSNSILIDSIKNGLYFFFLINNKKKYLYIRWY